MCHGVTARRLVEKNPRTIAPCFAFLIINDHSMMGVGALYTATMSNEATSFDFIAEGWCLKTPVRGPNLGVDPERVGRVFGKYERRQTRHLTAKHKKHACGKRLLQQAVSGDPMQSTMPPETLRVGATIETGFASKGAREGTQPCEAACVSVRCQRLARTGLF